MDRDKKQTLKKVLGIVLISPLLFLMFAVFLLILASPLLYYLHGATEEAIALFALLMVSIMAAVGMKLID